MSQSVFKFSISPTSALSKAWDAVFSGSGNFFAFVLTTIIYYIISTIVGRIPGIGFVNSLLQFVLGACLFSGFDAIERTGGASANDLFSWGPRFAKLLGAHLIMFLIVILLMIPLLVVLFSSLGTDFWSDLASGRMNKYSFTDFPFGTFFGTLSIAILGIILLGIFFFALSFIVQFRDVSIGQAIKLSLEVGKANAGTIIVFGFLSVGLLILGAVAIGIGLAIAIPLIFGTQYFMLRSVFPREQQDNWDFMQNR